MPKRNHNAEIVQFAKEHRSVLATTRFNNKTWQENQDFYQRAYNTGEIASKVKCIYPCSVAIGSSIPYQSNVLVLEMNNEMNKIMGIGLIKNVSPAYQKYNVYETTKHNVYTYLGGFRIDRAEFTEDEMKTIGILECYCFKGKRHQKRLNGIKAFPMDILYDIHHREKDPIDLNTEVANMFRARFISPVSELKKDP